MMEEEFIQVTSLPVVLQSTVTEYVLVVVVPLCHTMSQVVPLQHRFRADALTLGATTAEAQRGQGVRRKAEAPEISGFQTNLHNGCDKGDSHLEPALGLFMDQQKR